MEENPQNWGDLLLCSLLGWAAWLSTSRSPSCDLAARGHCALKCSRRHGMGPQILGALGRAEAPLLWDGDVAESLNNPLHSSYVKFNSSTTKGVHSTLKQNGTRKLGIAGALPLAL